jgi:hypothetical protein
LLLWKSTLLIFGGTRELIEAKQVLHAHPDGDSDKILTASPLDYHIFRQEITSKYPAYNPPPPLLPLEPNNSTVLPPLPSHPSRSESQDGLYPGSNMTNGAGKSIFHQPVHISTPAPSPPPSPAGPGGKGGKKQNYQTNQNFPFLYPPLDSDSSDIGGKGNAKAQDGLVGKRWSGSDIPASIVEAGQLFASRMRMSRSLRQLWEVREEYIKFERGWKEEKPEDDPDLGPEDMGLGEAEGEKKDWPGGRKSNGVEETSSQGRGPTRETDNEAVQSRLDAVEDFYVGSMPRCRNARMC